MEPSRVEFLHRRLARLHALKKESLSSYQEVTQRLVALNKTIEALHLGGNDRLSELYQSEFEYLDTDRAQDEHGRTFKGVEEEIEEVLADVMVPHEARAEDECQIFAGE